MWERGGGLALLRISVIFSVVLFSTNGEVLTPPYFNLAAERHITASATCGEGVSEPELYCKLVGANADRDVNINLIQGQVCDVCDPSRPDKMHPASFAVDGAETWWQSPPLSRSMKLNEVNLTIDFGQEFHVAYVFIKMANSPRPGVWVLERSKDNGKTFTPWQYFADTPADCEAYFGRDGLQPITRDDSVVCDTQFSKVVPLENGEIVVSLLNNRPSAQDFFNSTVLQEWTKATNVRLRFLRTKTLLGHLMSVARQDPTVTRRYFYSIKDISIGGRCMCNGHADTCDNNPDPKDLHKLVCRCQHNTCGDQCQTCCRGFQQKKWKQSKANALFVCEPCNCFGHSDECEYSEEVDEQRLSIDLIGRYEGGGVCQNCRHNTEGINCNRCRKGYYRPFGRPLNATDVCERCQCDVFYSTGNCAEGTGKCECREEFQEPDCDSCSFGYFDYPNCKPCECFLNGTRGYHCEAHGGACPCKPNYAGKFCKQCADGYYDFPNCLSCDCNVVGALSDVCDIESGNCTCKNNFGGRSCDRCKHGYYSFPDCIYCSCDNRGTKEEICEKESGKCICKEGFGGERCDQCVPGYYGYPDCRPCNCSETGSSTTVCDSTGKCPCLYNFAGRICDQCSPGYYQYPKCLPCDCNQFGSVGLSCDNDGKCRCKDNFGADKCDVCREGFYNFPACEDCNCDPAGVVTSFAGCGSVPPGELCECKPRVQGRICNECRPLFWNLRASNPDGCEDCDCYIPGVLGGIGECNHQNGQCICKPGVESRRCDACKEGFYGLDGDDLFGCTDCGCDIGGAVDKFCDKDTGQCICQPRVTGRDCKQPLQAHYFPTLYSELQFEAEEAVTPSRGQVRYGFSEEFFPGYSWKGYAVFSQLQNEIVQEVFINKPSLYRMVLRYVNPTNETITGTIKIVPENVHEVTQVFHVQLKPSKTPTLVTVSGPAGGIPSPLVMNPGPWAIHISISKNVFLDYFVLLPAAFYEATILEERIETPCSVGHTNLCRHYNYPELNFDKVHAERGGYLPDVELREPLHEFYLNSNHLNVVKEQALPIIAANQSGIGLDLTVSKPGRHVLLVNYITPLEEWKTTTLNIETSTSTLKNKGVVELAPCPYDEICRQVSTDKLGRIQIYNFDTNYVGLVLKGNFDDNTTVAVQSVTAVPVEEWSLDFIRPKPVCVKKDGQCVPSTYPIAPDSKKIEFEQEVPDLTATQLPNEIYDNKTGLVYLTGPEANLNIRGTVPFPGSYVFLVHYFQPTYPEFTTQVLIQNGQFYEAKLPTPHCPSNAGCRSVVTQPDGNYKFSLIENFVLSFKKPDDKSLWLDYILVIPADQFSEAILEEEALDQTSVFISQCGNNHFDIPINTTGFCRDAVFSLTTQYYDGALKCECNYAGSLSFECEQFGGQCQCKENVIGRRCDLCKTGYYGFPNCRPCSCPATSLCQDETGECICPPRVTGEKCDQCENQTYGYDPIIGCEECNCHPDGVQNYNLQCDLYTGICQCKENIEGRTCDQCRAGHYAFPNCLECACDTRGTTEEVCDQETSACHCKSNVEGQACDLCKDGTFHISGKNPDGCTKCFCFGKTTRCSSSNLYRAQIDNLETFDYASIEATASSVDLYSVDPADPEANIEEQNIYFSLPKSYLGNKLTSYGGYLNYTISFGNNPFGDTLSGPDIIIFGADLYLLHFSLNWPYESNPFESQVEIIENSFQLKTGFPATREQIMQVLEDLQGIFIRATYGSFRVTPRLEGVSLDIATPNFHPDAIHALAVEQCQCPPNYQGLSCEECAPGFYRAQTGPFGGYCVPCQCNGHTDTCDPITGKCIDCKHNTYGDHCESCNVGYHGNATIGTPFDCLICACPLPIPSNNFALSCDVSEDGERISCNCKDGYYGARCEACSAGYFGRPEIQGDHCKRCNCSGNINPNDPGACDSISGECLRCLNNTFGAACNLCAPGFYGDAVVLKDCKTCDCNKCGTHSCESYTGQCVCHDNVIGEQCDRCAPEHFGFKRCQGCISCDCAPAAESSYCDDDTGQCKCRPGVAGRTCDRCAAGFWNYSPSGCVTCGCNTEYSVGVGCNAETGQCECLPGVIGDRCDHCPHRWVLIPDSGCFECNTCTHDLLDTTDHLRNLIDPVMTEFKTVADSYFTTQRLKYINETAVSLIEEVTTLDPSKFDVKPLIRVLDGLELEVKEVYRKAEFAMERGEKSAVDSDRVRGQSVEIEDLIQTASRQSANAVYEVANLAKSLNRGAGPQIDSAVAEAQRILKDIQQRSLAPYIEKARYEEGNATEIREKMKNFTVPITEQAFNLENLRDTINDFNDKLDDLINNTAEAIETSFSASQLNHKNKNAKLTSKVYTILNMTRDANDTLTDAKMFLKNATVALNDARSATAELVRERNRGNEAKNNLNATLLREASELADLSEPVRLAQIHSDELTERARQLNESLAESRKTSGLGVEAARAYANIADDIEEAKTSAENAISLAENAIDQTNGLSEKTNTSEVKSNDLLSSAREALIRVNKNLAPQLKDAKRDVQNIENLNYEASTQDDSISKQLRSISNGSDLESTSNRALKESAQADVTAQDTLSNIKSIIDKVPEEVKQAKQLPKDIGAINHDISQAKNQLAKVNEILPDIGNLMLDLKNTQANLKDRGSEISEQIARLKRQVAEARDLVSRVKVGVTFQPNTFVEIKNPEDLSQQSTTTKVSAYFKTEKPNGVLLYLGNEVGTSRKLKRALTDDFLSVEIENGHPVVAVDLGSGHHRINSDMNVTLGTWYQFIVERTGKHVKLTIREDLGYGREAKYVKEEVIPGSASILNLDPEESKIYVGGIPASAKMQPAIKYTSFDGEIEDLVIGETPISLWNFRDAENNRGAHERDRLISLTPSTGYRFNGNGYAILDSRSYRMDLRSAVSLKFKTSASDGLLFLIGKGRHFLSLELKDGKVVYQYNLGDDTAVITSEDTFNDNKWHVVEASRKDQEGALKVDDVEQLKSSTQGSGRLLQVSEYMFFGGYPGEHPFKSVSQVDFDGCIDGVLVDSTSVDLSKHVNAFGISPGCPAKFASIVTFKEDQGGFIRYPNTSADHAVDLSLRFKTNAPNGIILLAATRDRSDPFSLSLVDGKLVVMSQGATLASDTTPLYNDNQWHAITATHDRDGLKLSVDDYETFNNERVPSAPTFKFGSLYVGGVPGSYPLGLGKVGTNAPFSGCIGDVTFNGVLINFANATERENVLVGKCTEAETQPAVVPHGAPTIPGEEDGERLPEPAKKITPGPMPGPGPETAIRKPSEGPTTPVPTPASLCALPQDPAPDPTNDFSHGYRFGTLNGSRLEYRPTQSEESDRKRRQKNNFVYSLDFKTNYADGILLYSSGKRHIDFIALYIKDGRIHFGFNCGSGAALIVGEERYDDGQWHNVIITKENTSGNLTIDGILAATGESVGTAKTLNIAAPYYIGGLDPVISDNAKTNLKGLNHSFEGCIRKFQFSGKIVENFVRVGVVPCAENVEAGVFFASGGGFVRAIDSFRVGSNIDVKMEIKPRSTSGVLLAVHGKKDYLLLQMVDGVIKFTVDNGKGPITSSFKPPKDDFLFCDGNWHSIHAVQAKNVVVLSVDSENSDPGIGVPGSTSTDTKSPLFIGSAGPRGIRQRGNITPHHYIGCIKNVFINDNPIKLPAHKAFGNVTVSACPTI